MDEKEIATMEGHMNYSSDSYFNARHDTIDSRHNRHLFDAGFRRGYDAALKVMEKLYPCERCGKLRTKAEGGTTFTVCDDCWDEKSTT